MLGYLSLACPPSKCKCHNTSRFIVLLQCNFLQVSFAIKKISRPLYRDCILFGANICTIREATLHSWAAFPFTFILFSISKQRSCSSFLKGRCVLICCYVKLTSLGTNRFTVDAFNIFSLATQHFLRKEVSGVPSQNRLTPCA